MFFSVFSSVLRGFREAGFFCFSFFFSLGQKKHLFLRTSVFSVFGPENPQTRPPDRKNRKKNRKNRKNTQTKKTEKTEKKKDCDIPHPEWGEDPERSLSEFLSRAPGCGSPPIPCCNRRTIPSSHSPSLPTLSLPLRPTRPWLLSQCSQEAPAQAAMVVFLFAW